MSNVVLTDEEGKTRMYECTEDDALILLHTHRNTPEVLTFANGPVAILAVLLLTIIAQDADLDRAFLKLYAEHSIRKLSAELETNITNDKEA